METNLGREELNEYLENPLPMEGGNLSTQSTLSATSLSEGGLTGKMVIRYTGEIVIIDENGVEVVKIDKTGITVSDGTYNRVKIGDIS